jgi:hypothetical protein
MLGVPVRELVTPNVTAVEKASRQRGSTEPLRVVGTGGGNHLIQFNEVRFRWGNRRLCKSHNIFKIAGTGSNPPELKDLAGVPAGSAAATGSSHWGD